MNSCSRREESSTTYLGAASQQLDGLWRAVHGSECPAEVRAQLSVLFEGWGHRSLPTTPEWPSDIGDDHSPFEFSIALGTSTSEIRLVVEAQGDRPDFVGTREACLRLNEALGKREADLRRFDQVRDLFLPGDVTRGRFALWHAVSLTRGPMQAKAYMNPQARGPHAAGALVDEAFKRLGMPDAWASVTSTFPGIPGEAVRYFALDLDRSATARAKVYLYPRTATCRDLERVAALRPGYLAGEVTEFCRQMTGTTDPDGEYPMCAYLAFVAGDPVPLDVTLQVPVRHYASNDEAVRQRVHAYLRARGLSTGPYERALAAVSRRALRDAGGLHSYVSLRLGATPPRLTMYFASETFGAHSGVVSAARRWSA